MQLYMPRIVLYFIYNIFLVVSSMYKRLDQITKTLKMLKNVQWQVIFGRKRKEINKYIKKCLNFMLKICHQIEQFRNGRKK